MSDAGELKRAGLKATLPRLRILALFEEPGQHHLSAEEVYRLLLERNAEVGLATVYRVLAQLEQAGLLKHTRFDAGRAIYELDDGQHHDHLICTECGWVVEFHDDIMEHLLHRAARRLGAELQAHTLVLYGRCTKAECDRRRDKGLKKAPAMSG